MNEQFQECESYVKHMRAEHRRLRELTQALLRDLHDPASSLEQIVCDAVTLRSELSHHFEEEEAGGCLEEAVSFEPALMCPAKQLIQDHGKLSRQLDAAIKHLREAVTPAEVLAEFEAFSADLTQHETAESKLLESSFGIPVE